MTASGTAGYGDELAAVPRPRGARRGRHQVARRVRVGRQPGAARARHAARDDQRRRAAGPGRRARGSTITCQPARAPAPRWCAASGAARSTSTAPRPTLLAAAPAEVVAVEVNLSCPNLEGRGSMFAHDADLSAAVIAATAGCGRPRWAKLSANTDRIVEVAAAVHGARRRGGDADQHDARHGASTESTLRPALGNGGGGVSGRAIHPIAVRAVHDVAPGAARICRSSASAASPAAGTRPS